MIKAKTGAFAVGYKEVQIVYALPVVEVEEPTIPKFKSKLKDATVSSGELNFSYKSSEITGIGKEKFNMKVTGYNKINCGCVTVKDYGSKGFKMVIDTDKITKKDVGEYLIQTAISLEGNDFKTES